MSPRTFTESVVEDAALGWLERLGYAFLHGLKIGVDMLGTERTDQSCRDVALAQRLPAALRRHPTRGASNGRKRVVGRHL